MKVTIIGLGYIGLPTSALIASHDIEVLGFDIDKSVVDTVSKGQIHIIEPELDSLVKRVVDSGFLRASNLIEPGDVYLIVVPTPFKENFEPDTSHIEDATKRIIPFLKEGDLFIIESTSPVGTTEKMKDLIFSRRPELIGKISIAYCPERVLPGNVINELINNDRVVGGVDIEATNKAKEFYEIFVNANVHVTDAKTAEMCKLVENSSRDVQIAFANELSIICHKSEIDVRELIHLANMHPRVNILQPGCGVGGHCIAVDPHFIISNFPEDSKIITSAREVNNSKPVWCVDKIKEALNDFEFNKGRKATLGVFGLSFKPNIDDLRESPAEKIAYQIKKISNSKALIFSEPNISMHKDFTLSDYKKSIEQCDIIVFLVSHDEFKDIEIPKSKVVLDFCGVRN